MQFPEHYGAVELPGGPYANSTEHLWDELRRIDQYVRAQTVRWHVTIGASKAEELWGMAHVTSAEIAAYLNAPFTPPHQLPAELLALLMPYWVTAKALAVAIQTRCQTTPATVELRLARLCRLYGLSTLARDVLLVCLLPELDVRYRRLFGYLQDDVTRTRPTVELVLQILHPVVQQATEGRALFDPGAPLLAHQLLVIDATAAFTPAGGDNPLALRSLRLDDRIAAYLLGNDSPDARLQGLMSAVVADELAWDQVIMEPERFHQWQALAQQWSQSQHAAVGLTLLLHGPPGSGRLAAARAFCTAAATPLLVVEAGQAFYSRSDWPQLVQLCYREATLRAAALYWAWQEAPIEPSQSTDHWATLIAAAQSYGGLSFLARAEAWEPLRATGEGRFLRVEFPNPGYELRRRLWDSYLPRSTAFAQPSPERTPLVETLANSFQLTEGQVLDAIASAWRQATLRTPESPALTVDDLYAGCRRQSSQRLATMAQRIEPRSALSFDDLILPETNKRQLTELRHRIRYHSRVYTGLGFEQRLTLGKGLIALFTGSSGTGKTMAAELLASEQGVDLYQIDLAAVVSKYVGETEKNLSQVFAEAEDANAILFFDEADALFGKRGEVKESRDRWANMEVNYLLQRVEAYAGAVIMASNLRQNIDDAFLRRIHILVEFPFPSSAARLRILQGLFPAGIQPPPTAELRVLAEQFELAGGSLKNVIIDAAFRAMAGSSATTATTAPQITLRHLVLATAREYQKLGKPITKGEFGEPFYGWVSADIL